MKKSLRTEEIFDELANMRLSGHKDTNFSSLHGCCALPHGISRYRKKVICGVQFH